ncbi:unnamed protein product [Urochloa decumbens]|uniref:Protein kinase domain-containing protein n=1 Tax=Urochloa decumbens TaxID=240449 RepID=A0ABC8WZ87_9POAL
MSRMPLHLHFATVVVVLSMSWATVAADQRRPVTLPGCPDKCGNISIPYPFGTKAGCYFDPTFSVTCNLSTMPPATLNAPLTLKGTGYYLGDQADPVGVRTDRSWWTVDLIDVDVARGEARLSMPISSDCSLNGSYHELRLASTSLNLSTTFQFSSERNVLVGVGQSVRARVFGGMAETNYSAACNSLFDAPAAALDGLCEGIGCCQAELAPGLVSVMPSMYYQSNSMWKTFPCTYSMVVDRSWYNFSLQDLYGYRVLDDKRFPEGAPVVLDWAIRNGSCPVEGKPLPMACRSDNSRCVNATNGYGYLCKCKDGFDGNPYIPGGCQDIDECALRQEQPELRDSYPCHGICKNSIGRYECHCKFGMKGDGKNGTCTPVFHIPAMVATLGIVGVASILVIVVLFNLLLEEKRKTKDFFIKNGGPILEKVNNIKIFKKEELKSIIEPCNVIGKGGFGEVYKGLLDSQLVAIKKSINVDKSQEKQFANEIIIQSRVIHKNIVKLIGCCLEVDVPMLVYEFVPQGSLHDILHGCNKVSLSLGTRLNIAAGAGEGLSYMHSKTSTTILHGDIKPGNILLDDNFDPKISDFGISRLIAIDKSHTKCVIGDMCYMDPIYIQSGLLTKKSDVYSFGVVLLELLCRKKAAFGEDRTVVKAFLDGYREDRQVLELFDKEILVEKDTGVLHELAMLIVECLELDVDRRPEMTDVAERLHGLKRSHKNMYD